MGHVKRPVVDGVRLLVPGGRVPPIEGGTICITAFFFIFSSRRQSSKDEITVSPPQSMFIASYLAKLYICLQVLHTAIDHLDYKVGASVAVLYLKDFRRLHLEFSFPEDCKDIVEALEVLSRPGQLCVSLTGREGGMVCLDNYIRGSNLPSLRTFNGRLDDVDSHL